MNLAELNAALEVATQLFPFFTNVVKSIEGAFHMAPGPTKLDTAMAMTQTALAAASADTATVTAVTSMAPNLIALAKAQYNAELAKPITLPAAQ